MRLFQDYIEDPNRRFSADTVAAIGLCANRLPTIPTTFVDGLLAPSYASFQLHLLVKLFGC